MSKPEIGSWHVDGHNMASVIRKTVGGWETVARCPNENGTWREDARLMAAAPEMLAVLKHARERMIGGGLKSLIEMTDAVLAKAEGRS